MFHRVNESKNVTGPFDTFVEEQISCALDLCFQNNIELTSYELFWSNGKRQKVNKERESTLNDIRVSENGYHCYEYNKSAFLVSMQRIAKITGEYWHDDEATKLCVHPVYGTWTAFRAIVLFETTGNAQTSIPAAPQPCKCPVSNEEIRNAKVIFDHALKLSSSDNLGYGATLDKSWAELCKYLHNTVCSGSAWDKVPSTMKPWIQLRDTISVGREDWKYDDSQLLYHYTKDPEILSRELEKMKNHDQRCRV